LIQNSPIVVIKVGGSLLDRPDLPECLGNYLALHADKRMVLVVGGGLMADHLRDLDRIHSIGESKSHALAIEILEVTAQVLASLIPGTRVTRTLSELAGTWSDGFTPVLSPHKLLSADEYLSRGIVLPRTWSVTTDSISAHLASLLGAESLILLKRGINPPELTIRMSSILGITDPLFPEFARRIARVEYYAFPSLVTPATTIPAIAPRLLSW
jgi:aspartokinase-like uncharacterized kinase